MKLEQLDVFDENRQHVGVATRKVVHQQGLWHQTFQCWLSMVENSKIYIIFQIRHENKDLYPNKLDITAAGHLLAGEKPSQGIRELEEELGIQVNYDDLTSLGIFTEKKVWGEYLDYEHCHVYLYPTVLQLHEFKIQEEEVRGLVKIELSSITSLFLNKVEEVKANGFIQRDGKKIDIERNVTKKDFVPHQNDYYLSVFQAFSEYSKQYDRYGKRQ